jgi:hypothetical protein
MTCPTAFTYEESAALWHALQAAREDHAGARAERDFYRSAIAEADAAAREARAERDLAIRTLGAVRAVVGIGYEVAE